MKKSKIVIASGLLAITVAGSAMAWGGGEPCEKSGNIAEKLDHIVDLTDEQEQAIEKIQQDNRNAFIAQYGEPERHGPRGKRGKHGMKEMLMLDPASPDFLNQVETKATEKAERMKAAAISKAKTMQQVYGILTDDQRQTLAEKKEKMRSNMEKRKAH